MSYKNKKISRPEIDEEGYMSLVDYIPLNISREYKEHKEICKTDREREVWDIAVRECIKATVLDACGFPGPQVSDMQWLLYTDWDWEKDQEFYREVRKRFGDK